MLFLSPSMSSPADDNEIIFKELQPPEDNDFLVDGDKTLEEADDDNTLEEGYRDQ